MAGRDLPTLFLILHICDQFNRRVPARQPCSFSLIEPQRKRTKRNDSLAAGISVAVTRCFDSEVDELIAAYLCCAV